MSRRATRTLRPRLVRAVLAGVTAALAGAAAFADGERHGAALAGAPPAYRQECAACHVAYPPGLLPPDAWRRVMDGLPNHYGTDASLDAATRTALTDWLVANAASGRGARAAPPEDRITRSAWFRHEHDEVPAAAWRRASIQSPANCNACHLQADRGNFDEHRIRIPR